MRKALLRDNVLIVAQINVRNNQDVIG